MTFPVNHQKLWGYFSKKVSEMFEMVEITHKPVEHTTEAEPELTPSGRLRRGAAKRLVPVEFLCTYVI